MRATLDLVRAGGITVFVLAYFVSSHDQLQGIREAVGVPLRVVRLSVPLPDIEQRLASNVTTERREEAQEAARQIATGAGARTGTPPKRPGRWWRKLSPEGKRRNC